MDEEGDVVSYSDYYPFGLQMDGRTHAENAKPTRENYTGHELDMESEMLYAGARYYDPVIGRWPVVDPLADKYPNLSPYAYVDNNPIGFFDPDGEYKVSANGRTVTRISRTAASFHSAASYVPVLNAPTLIYKALREDPSYPVTGADLASLALGGTVKWTRGVVRGFADGLGRGILDASAIGTGAGLNFAVQNSGEQIALDANLFLDEQLFSFAQGLGIGNQNIANAELFQVNEALLAGRSDAEASSFTNGIFTQIKLQLMNIANEGNFDLSARSGRQAFAKFLQENYGNLSAEELREEFGINLEN